MSQDKKSKNKQIENIKDQGIALSTLEVTDRGGSATAEFLKGLRGVDNQTGQVLNRSHQKISTYKINPEYVENNLKQQAGFSAEVASTSRDNANAIFEKSDVRTSRSEDLSQYGKNHKVVDRVKLQNGKIIAGSEAQMKFVGNPDKLIDKIIQGKNDLSRYQNVKLELPSEQVASAKQYCFSKADKLRKQANSAETKGNIEWAKDARNNADKYERYAKNIEDSGLTSDEAMFYRKHPNIATAKDMIGMSHRAGTEGAKYGAVVGGVISLVQNYFQLALNKKGSREAIKDIACNTAKAGALGYGSAFMGSGVKAFMEQSKNATMRSLAKTSLPAQVVSICTSLLGNIRSYVQGEIDEVEFAERVGEQGMGMLSSGFMAGVGQLAIPIPVVGAVIGGMIGSTISNLFYQSALDASRQAKEAKAHLSRTKAICDAACVEFARQEAELKRFMDKEYPELCKETQLLFDAIKQSEHADDFAKGINRYAENLLGKKLEFESQAEFDEFMKSDKPFIF